MLAVFKNIEQVFMKSNRLFILAFVLACSAAAFSLLGRLDSTLSSVSMWALAAVDFALIFYFLFLDHRARFFFSTPPVHVALWALAMSRDPRSERACELRRRRLTEQ